MKTKQEIIQRLLNEKHITVEEAMTLSVEGISINNRTKLQQQGVKEFTLGDLTEKYGTGLSSSYNSTQFISNTAKELMKYYLAGSVSIC